MEKKKISSQVDEIWGNNKDNKDPKIFLSVVCLEWKFGGIVVVISNQMGIIFEFVVPFFAEFHENHSRIEIRYCNSKRHTYELYFT